MSRHIRRYGRSCGVRAFSCSAFQPEVPRRNPAIEPDSRGLHHDQAGSPCSPAGEVRQMPIRGAPRPGAAALRRVHAHWGHPHAVGYLQRPDGIGLKKGTRGSTPYCKGTFWADDARRIKVASRPPAVQYLVHGGFMQFAANILSLQRALPLMTITKLSSISTLISIGLYSRQLGS